ncbi:MAG: hypothetical protein ACK5M4_10545 [Pseudorhodobacter sp.]
MLKNVASLWIGERLGPMELASIRSFIRQGHEFTLFAYEKVENCPSDATFRDAREILDAGRIIRHYKTQSPAPHSDIFRYAMIRQTDFTWVDLDVVALRPFDFPDDHVFGHESADRVASGILRLPPESSALARLMEINVDTKGLPPHLTGLRKLKYRIRNAMAGGLPVDRWPWGAIGPRLLTLALRETGEISKALPVSAFYSVPLQQAACFAEPGGYDAEQAPEGAYAVHLWASHLRHYIVERYDGKFPAESFVNRVCHDDW